MNIYLRIFLFLIPFFLLFFWMWMFSEMMKNNEITSSLKRQWVLAFIILNIFAAIYYYFSVYQKS
ncbi:MAG TPA: hypothetical protein VHE53_04080 [Patescibacteria group bacterium]|nr:hypothetical protein [Patescibacteria group bacterium]